MAWERNPLAAFEAHFTKSSDDDCWLWRGNTTVRGSYGAFTHRPSGAAMKRAHRASWEFYRGPIPDGMSVLHRCDTPLCVNPSHLFLGTQAENMTDKVKKARQNRGSSHGMAKLRDDEAKAILLASGLQSEIAKSFGVTVVTVSDIKRGRSWRHLQNDAN